MSWLGNFAGAVGSSILGGAIGDFFGGRSSARQEAANRKLMEYQNQLNVENYKHRYQWQMADMRAAGLNPILSANLGAGGASAASLAGVGMANPTGIGDIGTNFSANQRLKTEEKLKNRELDIADKEADTHRLAEENTAKDLEFRQGLDKEKWLLDSEIKKRGFALEELKVNKEIEMKLRELEGRLELMKAQGESAQNVGYAALMQAENSGVLAETARLNGISQRDLQSAEKIYKEAQAKTEGEREKYLREVLNDPIHRGVADAVGLIHSVIQFGAMNTRFFDMTSNID